MGVTELRTVLSFCAAMWSGSREKSISTARPVIRDIVETRVPPPPVSSRRGDKLADERATPRRAGIITIVIARFPLQRRHESGLIESAGVPAPHWSRRRSRPRIAISRIVPPDSYRADSFGTPEELRVACSELQLSPRDSDERRDLGD